MPPEPKDEPTTSLGWEREVGRSRPSCPQLMEQGGLDSQPSGDKGLLWVEPVLSHLAATKLLCA